MINDVVPIEEDEEEYNAVKSWVLKNKVENITIVMSNDAFSQLCPDCEEDFKYIKELNYVTVDDTEASIVEKYIKNDQLKKYIYKTYRDNGWQTYDDEVNHLLIYKMDLHEHIFIIKVK